MTWGQGYIWGIGAAFIPYLIIRSIDRDYYKRKRAILKKRKAELKARKLKAKNSGHS